MPTSTYDLIASNTISVATTTVTFSSIPGTYRDLVFTIDGKATVAGIYAYVRANGSSGTYNYTYGGGYGSSMAAGSPGDNKIQVPGNGSYWSTDFPTSVFGNVMDYASTDKHKVFLIRSGATTSLGATEMMSARFPSTSAITSISFTMNAGNFAIGSNFQLYGIVA